MEIANLAIGGQLPTIPGVTTPTLSQINQALDELNRGFYGCRFLCGFSSSIPTAKLDAANESTTIANGVTLSSYPNPFNTNTTIEFVLDANADVTVEVFSVTGVRVAVLYNGAVNAGDVRSIEFDAASLAPGLYTARLSTADQSIVHKMVLIK